MFWFFCTIIFINAKTSRSLDVVMWKEKKQDFVPIDKFLQYTETLTEQLEAQSITRHNFNKETIALAHFHVRLTKLLIIIKF